MQLWEKRKHALMQTTVCLLLAVAMTMTVHGNDENTLKLDPSKEIAIEVGKAGTVTCALPAGANSSDTIMWLNENGTDVNVINRTQIRQNGNTLNLQDMALSDSGPYTCTTKSRAYNSTVTVKVYVMPDYFTEGMVIIGINVFLVVVFLGCASYRFIQGRREQNQKQKKNRPQ